MIILVLACTHGGWAHRQRVSTIFLTRKNSQMFHVLLTGFKPSSFGSESNALPIELVILLRLPWFCLHYYYYYSVVSLSLALSLCLPLCTSFLFLVLFSFRHKLTTHSRDELYKPQGQGWTHGVGKEGGDVGHKLLLLLLLRTLIGVIPMVTMAQSAANWRNTHTHMDRTHSLTHLQHSHNTTICGAKRQLSY